MATKVRNCDEKLIRERLKKAEQFMEVAADVICCKALGHHVQGDDHLQAVGELSKVVPGGKQLGSDLKTLLQLKTRAGYGGPSVTADQRKRARRKAEGLVEAARER
jgi:hypothetical protein